MYPDSDHLRLVVRQQGPLATDVAERALAWATKPPWGRPPRMSLHVDHSANTDTAAALTALAANADPVNFEHPDGWGTHVSSAHRHSTLAATLPREMVDLATVADTLRAMARCFPSASYGWASADHAVAQWYDDRALPVAPARFDMYIRWLHLLTDGWDTDFDPVALQAIEGTTLVRYDDGTATLQAYDDPFEFARPTIRDHISEVSEATYQASR